MGTTRIGIEGERFLLNGRPTHEGSHLVEGLLFNVRTVHATFDDTLGIRSYWDDDGTRPENDFAGYGRWQSPASAVENTNRFIAGLSEYRAHGILAVNLNFQGGHPLMCKPWIAEGEGSAGRRPNGQRDFLHNSGFRADGAIDPNYAERISKVVEACDRLGMAVILQLFYFGQDTIFPSEREIKRAVDAAVDYIAKHGYANVVIEIANEVSWGHYHHEILKPARVAELVAQAKQRARDVHGMTPPVATSEAGLHKWPLADIDAVFSACDVVILHGPGEHQVLGSPEDAEQPRAKVELIRSRPWFKARPRPILFNESSGEEPLAYAVRERVSWGLHSGMYFQTMWPPKWGVWENEIQWFFERVKELTQRSRTT